MIVQSKRTMTNITQNIIIALGLKAVFLVTTIAGMVVAGDPRRHRRHRPGYPQRSASLESSLACDRNPIMRSRVFSAAAVLVIASFVILAWASTPNKTVKESLKSSLKFTLTDHEQHIIHNDDLQDKWLMISFGSVKCREVCLSKLGTISVILNELGATADQIQPIMITVDPERDKPSVLRNYLKPFDSRILGLTGTYAQVQSVVSWFRVYDTSLSIDLEKINDGQMAFFYLLDKRHGYSTRFASFLPIAEILRIIRTKLHSSKVSLN